MAFLRNILLLLVLSTSLVAQENNDINNAFSKSFGLESEGQYAEAILTIEKVYSEEHYTINLRLGWLYYNAKAYERAEHYYGVASELLPYSIEAMLGTTLPKSALNKWDEVLAIYKSVLAIDSKNTTALYNMGLIKYNRGEYREALTYFNELHNLYPTDYDAMLMHGWAAYQTAKMREAKVIFNQLLLLYPNDESAQEGLKLMK